MKGENSYTGQNIVHQESTMKYIMFEDFSGAPVPVIFPARVGFAEMREQMPYTTALSAGHVTLGPDGFTCHGSAKELDLKADPGDAAIMADKFADSES